MPVDLERAFEELRSHTRTVILPSGAELRRRSDRRRYGRIATGLVAVGVAVVAVTLGVPEVLGAGPMIIPGSPSPAVTGEHTLGPSPTSPAGCLPDQDDPGPALPSAGEALPASVMLGATEWGPCYQLRHDIAGYEVFAPDVSHPRPDLCFEYQPYPADAERTAGRVRVFGGGTEISAFESATRYAPGQAAAFMTQVRDRVPECAEQRVGGQTTYAFIADSDFAGDQSMVIYMGASPTGGGHPGTYQAVVRVGDVVLIVFPGFDGGGDKSYTVEMARKAAAHL